MCWVCVRVVLVLAGSFAFSLWPVAGYSFVVLHRMPWVFRSSFVRFESIKKTSPFCVGSAKNRGLYCSIQKVEVKVVFDDFLFWRFGAQSGDRAFSRTIPPKVFRGGRGESPIDT